MMNKIVDKNRVQELFNRILKSDELKEQNELKEQILNILFDCKDYKNDESESFVSVMRQKLDIRYDIAFYIDDKLNEIKGRYDLMNQHKQRVLKAFEFMNDTNVKEEQLLGVRIIMLTLKLYGDIYSESISELLKKYLFIEPQNSLEIEKKIKEVKQE